ncbi:MAG: calcium/sodium antiporter [Hahellaceae bacterium]|nr:calcium/sodium antiporter [Hahellaceae bacterium]
MLTALLAMLAGLILLIWSADKFVDGAASTARHLGVPALIIGMVIIGFGTSAPELVVSAIAASQGNPGVAVGNAIGSNITNIGLIIGLTALLTPITVKSRLIRREFPILLIATAFTLFLLWDKTLSLGDGVSLLLVFTGVMGWTIVSALRQRHDILARDLDTEAMAEPSLSLQASLTWLFLGILLLILSSRLLVWGAVSLAEMLGISDLVIGLTVIAIGTSLPELASSISAIRKNEHDLALGNVVGSNLFNTLAVIGLAGVIHPLPLETIVLQRDLPAMACATLLLFAAGFHRFGSGEIRRWQGLTLLIGWFFYNFLLVRSVISLSDSL